ncbi:MAG: TolC family protein [Candidatus Omnitrophica bacterium]|nr:TolC family protein [Candidatus Omnitrophota bacterium]
MRLRFIAGANFFLCFGLCFFPGLLFADVVGGFDALSLTSGGSRSVIYLTLGDVTQLGLINSLDLQIARYDLLISKTSLTQARSVFDSFLTAAFSYDDDQSQNSTSFSGTRSLNKDYSLAFTKKIPSGTTLTVSAYQDRSWTDSTFVSINPSNQSKLTFSLKQELGRNFFGTIDRLTIENKKIDVSILDDLTLDSVEETLSLIQKAYWELVLRQDILRYRRQILDDALHLYKIAQDKLKHGLIEDPELYNFQANAKTRESELLGAELDLKLAKNNLLFLLNNPKTDFQMQAVDSLEPEFSKRDLSAELVRAIDNRRDYRIVKKQVEAKNIDIRIKENSLWPQIDLEASFSRNGLSKKNEQSWKDMVEEDNPHFYLGLSVKIPLENRDAESAYKRTELEKEKIILQLKRTERLILKDISQSVETINTLSKRTELLKSVVELQNKKYDAEKKRFKYGRSDINNLVNYEDDLIVSRINLAFGIYAYKISLIDLKRQENLLLKEYWPNIL